MVQIEAEDESKIESIERNKSSFLEGGRWLILRADKNFDWPMKKQLDKHNFGEQ